MPRYFFHIYHERVELDYDGEELPDKHAAWHEATVFNQNRNGAGKSAAFRRMPALLGTLRHREGLIERGLRLCLIKFWPLVFSHGEKATSGGVILSVRSSTLLIREVAIITRFELVPRAEPSLLKSSAKKYVLKIAIASGIGQTHENFRVIVVLTFNRRVGHATPLGYTDLAL